MRSFMCAIMCLGTLATASSLVAQPPGQGRGNAPTPPAPTIS